MDPVVVFHDVTLLILLSVGSAAWAVTISRGSLFRPVRLWVKKRATSRPAKLLGKLLRCTYCATHWTTGALVLLYQPYPVRLLAGVDLLLSWLVGVFVAGILSGVLVTLLNLPEDENEPHYTMAEAVAAIKCELEIAPTKPPTD